jgi:mRNA interferase HicA
MKRRDLEKILKAKGYYKIRTGHERGNHEIWTNGIHKEPIPRKREIKEGTANMIIKRCELK